MSDPAAPAITWPQPAAINDHTPLSSAQLNATANVPGTFAYSPAAGTVLGAGTTTLSTTFTPSDRTHYSVAKASVILEVTAAKMPAITWPQPAAIDTATPLSSTQLDATANVAGTFVYSPADGATLAAGTQTLSVTFTPQDTVHYASASATVPIVVTQAASEKPVTISWAPVAGIPYPTPLGEAQLNAVAYASSTQDYVPGKFKYTPGYGTVLSPGTHTISATFTPDDASTYKAATMTMPITIDAATDCGAGPNTGGQPLVYLASWPWRSGKSQITGYAAAPDGSLTQVSGSPFNTAGTIGGVGAGSMFFGADSYSIYSYTVHSNGCISFDSALAAGQGDPENPQNYMIGPLELFLDAKGSNLYSWGFETDNGTAYASYDFDQSTGKMTQTSMTSTNFTNLSRPLAFPPSDQWGITSDYTIRGGRAISVFNRHSDGTLSTEARQDTQLPDISAPDGAAADATNHVVIAMQKCTDWEYCDSTGPWYFAVYSIDNAGTMTALDNWGNMAAASAFGNAESAPSWYAFSPDNRFFAAVGFTGIDVFAWDSEKAVLTLIGTIKNTEGVCQSSPSWSGCQGTGFGIGAWDSYDHLYTYRGNELHVYTVSGSGVAPAPGSPYQVANPNWVTVVTAHP